MGFTNSDPATKNAIKLIDQIPDYVKKVRGQLDENLTSKKFNYKVVRKYYSSNTYVMSNKYEIEKDLLEIIEGEFPRIIINYSMDESDHYDATNAEEFFSRSYERQFHKLLDTGIIQAVEVTEGNHIGIDCSDYTVGFVYGNIRLPAYYVENCSYGACPTAVHVNNPTLEVTVFDSMLIVKCKALHGDVSDTPIYIHYLEGKCIGGAESFIIVKRGA
jgi:hypothetical protein